MNKSVLDTFRRYYTLFTSGLSLSEIERLIKRDAPGIYDFYRRQAETPDRKQDPVMRGINFVSSLFMAFLSKLTPARRLFYALILFLFIYSLLAGSWILAGFSFLLLNTLLAFELADKLTAKDELEVAREIQMNLMPGEPPASSRFDIACFSEAARVVGGDYYDFIQPDGNPDEMFVIIGDVSGKGMGAALYMVQVQAILQNLTRRHRRPHALLRELDQHLRCVLRNGSFLTISVAGINGDEALRLCRAGHVPLIHYQVAGRKCREIVPGGIGVGLPDAGRFADFLEEARVAVSPGDILVFFTDGIVEMMNSRMELFSEERLKELICQNAALPAGEIQQVILESLAQFRGITPPHDDVTLIVMKAKTPSE